MNEEAFEVDMKEKKSKSARVRYKISRLIIHIMIPSWRLILLYWVSFLRRVLSVALYETNVTMKSEFERGQKNHEGLQHAIEL